MNDFDPITASIQEQDFACRIQNNLALYENTGDARYVWRAIFLFHEAKKPLPPALMAKLVDWGGRVQSISDPKEIAAALELTGDNRRHVGPRHSQAYQRRWRIASEVKIVRSLRASLTLAQAIQIVARNRGLTVAKVKKDYYGTFPAPRRRDKAQDLSQAMQAWR